MAIQIEFKAKTGVGSVEPSRGLAAWLSQQLTDTGIDASKPTMHDWGYEIRIMARGNEYYAGLPSRKEPGGNWHVFVDKRFSIRDRALGRATTPMDEPMAKLIQEIITREPDFKLVRVLERV